MGIPAALVFDQIEQACEASDSDRCFLMIHDIKASLHPFGAYLLSDCTVEESIVHLKQSGLIEIEGRIDDTYVHSGSFFSINLDALEDMRLIWRQRMDDSATERKKLYEQWEKDHPSDPADEYRPRTLPEVA